MQSARHDLVAISRDLKQICASGTKQLAYYPRARGYGPAYRITASLGPCGEACGKQCREGDPTRSPRPDEFSYKALIRGCCLLDETQKSLGGIFFFWGGGYRCWVLASAKSEFHWPRTSAESHVALRSVPSLSGTSALALRAKQWLQKLQSTRCRPGNGRFRLPRNPCSVLLSLWQPRPDMPFYLGPLPETLTAISAPVIRRSQDDRCKRTQLLSGGRAGLLASSCRG